MPPRIDGADVIRAKAEQEQAKLDAEHRKIELQNGLLGKYLGADPSKYLAFLFSTLLLACAMAVTYFPLPPNSRVSASDVWQWAVPFWTLAFGYIFGRNK